MEMRVWVTYMRCNLLTLRAAWGEGLCSPGQRFIS